MTQFRIFMAMIVLSICAACASDKGPTPTTTNLALPDRTAIAQTGDLRIGPMDLLKVSVFGVDELEGEYQVDTIGNLKMPLVGEISAKGYTAIEFSRKLEQRLGETYLQNPDVTVVILESSGEQITVEGSINKPGLYEVPGQLSLLQAIALSGGPTLSANERKVAIFRQVSGQRQVAVFDLKAIRKGEMPDPQVYGNDVIVVDGSQTRENYRDIIRAAPFLALFAVF